MKQLRLVTKTAIVSVERHRRSTMYKTVLTIVCVTTLCSARDDVAASDVMGASDYVAASDDVERKQQHQIQGE